MARRVILALALAALLVRLMLVLINAGRFSPDEARYDDARDAGVLLAAGDYRQGIDRIFRTGEHPGFKLLGLIPALIESRVGPDDRIPLSFLAIASSLNVLLIGLIARRLGLSPAAQVWATLWAAASLSLFYYARHLYPYDLAMFLALAGLFIGLGSRLNSWQFWWAGVLCGAAFLTYLAYGLLAGTVMVVLTLNRVQGWRDFLRRCMLLLCGFSAIVGLISFLSRLGATGDIANKVRAFSALNQMDGFGNSVTLPWEYLFASDPLLAGAVIVTAVCLVARIRHLRRGVQAYPELTIMLVSVLVTYGLILFSAEIVGLVLVTGRVSRLLVPFYCLLVGWSVAWFIETRRTPQLWRVAATALIIGGSLSGYFRVFGQQFPGPFRAAGERLLASLPPAEPGTYYRYVNVDHFFFQAETLGAEPEETLMEARHPYQFAPYVYEGFTEEDRQNRLRIDHRMRLVRMRMQPEATLRGTESGLVKLALVFPEPVPKVPQPLLSVGSQETGELLSVRFLPGSKVQLVLESVGSAVRVGRPMSYEPGAVQSIEVFTGSMLPAAGTDPAETRDNEPLRNRALVVMNGEEALSAVVAYRPAKADEFIVGLNRVGASSAGTAFTGKIIEATRGGFPAFESLPPAVEFGPVKLRIQPEAQPTGNAEPLVVMGIPENATLAYIRRFPDGEILVGIEVWGHGAFESNRFAPEGSGALAIQIEFPSIFPPVGDPAWDGVEASVQSAFRSRLRILVDGTVRLEQSVAELPQNPPPLSTGKNHAGGSLVSDVFGGQILSIERLELGQIQVR